jgi:hypothetical protein
MCSQAGAGGDLWPGYAHPVKGVGNQDRAEDVDKAAENQDASGFRHRSPTLKQKADEDCAKEQPGDQREYTRPPA